MIEIVLYVIILDVQALRLNSVPNGQLKKKGMSAYSPVLFYSYFKAKTWKNNQTPNINAQDA